MLAAGLGMIAIGGPIAPGREADILWERTDAGRRVIRFAPAEVVRGASFSDLGKPPFRFDFETRLSDALRLHRADPPQPGDDYCVQPVLGVVIGAAPEKGFEGLAEKPIVLTVTVERIVPGFGEDARPASLVWARVNRILTDRTGKRAEKEQATFLERIGRVEIQGITLCSVVPGYRLPVPGDRLLVAGEPDPENPRNIQTSEDGIFCVDGDFVVEPGPGPETERRRTLSEILRAFGIRNPKFETGPKSE